MSDIKPEEETINDRDLIGEKPVETAQIAQLTEEEKKLEKKLVRKIDFIILPLVLIVYLLNWIDRYDEIHQGGVRNPQPRQQLTKKTT